MLTTSKLKKGKIETMKREHGPKNKWGKEARCIASNKKKEEGGGKRITLEKLTFEMQGSSPPQKQKRGKRGGLGHLTRSVSKRRPSHWGKERNKR